MSNADQNEGGLALGAWRPEIHAALLDLINTHGNCSASFNAARPPIAAFDCDETLICNDLGEAMLRYMVTRRKFHADRGFWQLIPDRLGREAVQAAYNAVAGRSDAEVRDTAAYRRYRAGMLAVYENLRATDGLEAAYTFAARLMRGLHERTLNELVEEVLNYELDRPLSQEEIPGGPPFQGQIVPTGIRVYREMRNLLKLLDTYGFQTYIVTSSNAYVVRGLARRIGFPPERVLGIELGLNGVVMNDRVSDPAPIGPGKVEVLLDTAGRSPLLVIGDSMNDYELMENCDGLCIVMDRGDEEIVERAGQNGWMVQSTLSV